MEYRMKREREKRGRRERGRENRKEACMMPVQLSRRLFGSLPQVPFSLPFPFFLPLTFLSLFHQDQVSPKITV